MKKRRASVIYENELGILLAPDQYNKYTLPGGHAESGETRIIAAIRELYEETGLRVNEIKFLFEHESQSFYHKVFIVKADGVPYPKGELRNQKLAYYSLENSVSTPNVNIRFSTLEMLRRYKENYLDA